MVQKGETYIIRQSQKGTTMEPMGKPKASKAKVDQALNPKPHSYAKWQPTCPKGWRDERAAQGGLLGIYGSNWNSVYSPRSVVGIQKMGSSTNPSIIRGLWRSGFRVSVSGFRAAAWTLRLVWFGYEAIKRTVQCSKIVRSIQKPLRLKEQFKSRH